MVITCKQKSYYKMDGKLITFFFVIIHDVTSAGVLRTPKVYNAVITTDENLTPSRAFPVIEPTIHETGIATYRFPPVIPYSFYSTPILQFLQPEGVFSKADPLSLPPMQNYFSFETVPKFLPGMELQGNEHRPQTQRVKLVPISELPQKKLPIPFSELGLQPNLFPLHQYPQLKVNLQSYPSNNYPLIYDSCNQYVDHFLPSYGEYPSHSFGVRQVEKQSGASDTISQHTSDSKSSTQSEINSNNNNLDIIKNGINNKNSEVPDVPPPPLPSGAETSK